MERKPRLKPKVTRPPAHQEDHLQNIAPFGVKGKVIVGPRRVGMFGASGGCMLKGGADV